MFSDIFNRSNRKFESSLVNKHWLEFEPPKESDFIILAILYIFIMFLGIFGNGMVIFLFCRCKALRTPANTLIVNLAFSDLLMLLKMPVFVYNAIRKGPVLGEYACQLYGFLGGLSGTASIGTLAAISYDRFYVINYPLKRFSTYRIYISMACSWINALIFSIIPLLNIGVGRYQYEGYLISCSFDYLSDKYEIRIYIFLFFLGAFVAPMCIIGYSYFKIIRIVCGRATAMAGKRDSLRHVREESKRKQETKLAVTVFIVIFLWFFSWTPYAVVAGLGILGQKQLITPLSSMIPALFCKTTSAIDPYVYAISHPKFKEQIWKLFKNPPKRPKNVIWSSEYPIETTTLQQNVVEEEMVHIELKDFRNSLENVSSSFNAGNNEEFQKRVREVKRKSSVASLLCFKPNFTNRGSSFRRLSRKMTKSEKKNDENAL